MAHGQCLENVFKTNNHKKAIMADNECGLADDLNTFFARYESLDNPYKCTEILRAVTQP